MPDTAATIEQFAVVEATLTPKRLDTLRPELGRYIGQRRLWQAAWVVEEDDGGDYVGQRVFTQYPGLDDAWNEGDFGWVPAEDLSDIKVVRP